MSKIPFGKYSRNVSFFLRIKSILQSITHGLSDVEYEQGWMFYDDLTFISDGNYKGGPLSRRWMLVEVKKGESFSQTNIVSSNIHLTNILHQHYNSLFWLIRCKLTWETFHENPCWSFSVPTLTILDLKLLLCSIYYAIYP